MADISNKFLIFIVRTLNIRICDNFFTLPGIVSTARFTDVCRCSCGNVHVTSLACATYEYSTAHWISAVNFYFGILPLKIC